VRFPERRAGDDGPFVKRERGFSFSGLDEQNPLTDLMFFTYSPFRAGKFLFFWSRIDPELDRFQPLPFVGSNWAEQRDFLVIRQGMFDPEKPWPPVRNENAEADQVERLLEIDSQRTIRRTPHYEVYYLAGAALDRDLDAIVAARESAFAKAVAVLGAPPEDFKIRLLLYDSATDKKERSGVKDEAHSVPRAREIHLVQRMALVPSAHEEIHVLARQKLGPSFLTAMYEGLALAEDGIYAGTELDVLAAILVEQNAVPSLDNLFDEARFQSLEDRVAFPSAGLLVRFLRETAGPEGVARAYGLPYDAGLAGLAKALGKEAQPLAASWDRYTRDRAAARKADLEFRRQQVKAQERYAAADYAGVAEALEKALRARPEDPQTFFNLGAARMRTGEYAKAEKAFRQILAQTLAKKDAHLAAFSHYQIGRIYDVQGRRDAALAEYRIVLGLPDVNDSHRLANEALAQPVTQDQLE